MRKGRHRRHRTARQLKHQNSESGPRPGRLCDECGRRGTHADWCLAEADLGYVDDVDEPR